jgi:hypothetical protein
MIDLVGFIQAPSHYAGERETIDRIRDQSFVAARQFLGPQAVEFEITRLANSMFAYHCGATALKYEDRTGKKDSVEQDANKAIWYRQMQGHVSRSEPDPRANRVTFIPYERQKC